MSRLRHGRNVRQRRRLATELSGEKWKYFRIYFNKYCVSVCVLSNGRQLANECDVMYVRRTWCVGSRGYVCECHNVMRRRVAWFDASVTVQKELRGSAWKKKRIFDFRRSFPFYGCVRAQVNECTNANGGGVHQRAQLTMESKTSAHHFSFSFHFGCDSIRFISMNAGWLRAAPASASIRLYRA